MPSLRRAFSSPSVRASPYSYPTALLPSSRSHRPPHNHPHGGGYRRSSGSDVSSRKVLADIDWWRVADGQREQDDEDDEEMERGGVGEEENPASAEHADPEAAPAPASLVVIPELHAATDRGDDGESAGVEPERPSTPVASERSPLGVHDILGYSPQAHLFGQLASFAGGPRTPTRRATSESSASSLESTPEVLRTPIERLSFAGMGFADPGLDAPLFHMRLASLSTLPLAPKHVFAEQHGGLDNDSILADPLMCNDDLFA